jgi:hypothetical protein
MHDVEVRSRDLAADPVSRSLGLDNVTAGENNHGSSLGQHPGGRQSQSGISTGHDGDAPGLIGHIGRRPSTVLGDHQSDSSSEYERR